MGGILGRKIKVIKEDGASDWPTFAEKSKKLLVNDKVRRRVRLLDLGLAQGRAADLRERKRHAVLPDLLRRPGAKQERDLHRPGSHAADHLRPGLGLERKESQDLLPGRVRLHLAAHLDEDRAQAHRRPLSGSKVVGEEYYPLGHTNFNSLINKIKVAKPDCIFIAVVGGSNVAFYKQLKAAGVTAAKQFLLTISVTEDEVLGIGGENMNGFYASMKYFQSLDNPNNKAFVTAFKAKYGKDAVIGDVTQAGYLGPWLWKATVEKAGSFDVDKIAAASAGIELKTAPEGYVKLHENHHLWSKARIGQAQADGQFKVVAESPALIEPNPFPKGYQ
jgi:urea transport system substrate-binding protein